MLLLAPFVAGYSWLHLRRSVVREQVKHMLQSGIPEEKLERLVFTGESLHLLKWEHAGEFEFHGKMYDVVRKSKQGDHIIYYCFNDTEETELKRKLNHITSSVLGSDPPTQQGKVHLSLWFRLLAVHHYPGYEFLPGSDSRDGFPPVEGNTNCLSLPESPPPRYS